jgi:hypothetical protein
MSHFVPAFREDARKNAVMAGRRPAPQRTDRSTLVRYD